MKTKILASLLLAFAALPAGAQIVNGNFDAGTAGWNTAGDVAAFAIEGDGNASLWLSTASTLYADDFPLGIGASNVSGVAAMEVGSATGLESVLGLSPGAFDPDPDNGISAFEGSAAWQQFSVGAGQRVSFRWNFSSLDAAMADYAFAVIDGQVITLAQAPVTGATGWSSFSFDFASAGTHTLGFGVVDVGDYDLTSTLAVDDVRVAPVPEPATVMLMLSGLGLLAGWRRRRG